jgi:hypothetical protein
MTHRLLKVVPPGVLGALVAILTAAISPAQEPIPLRAPGQPGAPGDPLPLPAPGQPAQPAAPPAQQGDGVEVLSKGPIHEAFASTAEGPTSAPLVKKQPPDPIEEMPPDQKPAGDNVQWLPGYWHFDEEADRFMWISGFWRQPPPGRVWVPGSWRPVPGGWNWVGGFWQEVAPRSAQPAQAAQPMQEVEYLPEPPATLEVGPTVAAPTTTSMYVPGAWVWRGGRYVWRPGAWVEYRTNWVWVPARYCWTPAGYVFVEGYWDYPVATRGVLFAPIVFTQPVYVRPAYVYTPVYVVSEPAMMGALFVRRGCGYYYFGDYYDGGYADRGYCAFCGSNSGGTFVIGFGTGRAWGYDPMWSYYSVAYRSNPEWQRGMGDLYAGRYRGDLMRPPVTLVQQNTTIIKITNVTNVTNVTNNITVVNGAPTVGNKNVSGVAMVAPLTVAAEIQRTKYEPVSLEARRNEAAAARQIREVAVQRTKLETAVALQPRPAPGQPAQPRTIKLDVPKTSVVRAQMSEERNAPPPAVHKTAATSPPLKLDPPHAEPKGPAGGTPGTPAHSPTADPKADAKLDPKSPHSDPKLDPKSPHYDPKAGTHPKVDPKVDPKHTPPPKGDPPKGDPPKPLP